MYSKQRQSQLSIKIHWTNHQHKYYQTQPKTTEVKQNVTKGEYINTSQYLSCRQVIVTTTFESTQTKEKFNIYSKFSFYLFVTIPALQNTVGQKIGNSFLNKTEQPQKGSKNRNAIETFQYSNNWNHAFNKH